jgi:hypothetical protein
MGFECPIGKPESVGSIRLRQGKNYIGLRF